MRPTEHFNGSHDDFSPSAAGRLVTYEEAKADGGAFDPLIGDAERDELACVDLLHRVWPDLAPAVSTPEGLTPRTLGDFRLIRELGRGGMGTVFEAEQLSMGRHVALKVLPFAALVRGNALQRFHNEVRAAAALDHPNIVSVYSIGEERGVHFYAMQLIRGRTLADLVAELQREKSLARGPLSVVEKSALPATDDGQRTTDTRPLAALSTIPAFDSREHFRSTARLGIQAAEALQHAHDQGVLHRDIKPGNLMLDRDGKLYVTDFGLARIEADAGMTMTGDVLGTLRYMAPEQALAKRAVIDHRADTYSLAATLYELLTLKPAFAETDRAELLKQIAFEEPRPLRKLDGRIPAELETIVLKAMAKSCDERYQTAQLLADDLRAFLEDKPIKAQRPTLVSRAAKWSRRHQELVWTVALASVLLSAILAASMMRVQRAQTQAVAALEETSDLLYTTDMTLAYQTYEKGWSDEVQTILGRHRPLAGGPDRRGFEWYMLQTLVQQPVNTTIENHGVPVHELAIFPDRRRLASVSNDGTLDIWDVRARKLSRTIKICNEELHSVAISPDGRYVAVGSTAVYLYDLAQNNSATELFRGEYFVESLTFGLDGKRIVFGTRYDAVCLVTLDGQVVKRISCPSRNETLEFVNGSGLLLLNNREIDNKGDRIGTVQLWREDLSGIERELDSSRGRLGKNIAVARSSPCGRFVVGGDKRQSRAHLFEIQTERVVATTPKSRDWLSDLAYSPDGKAMAIGYRNGKVEVFAVRPNRDGSPLIGDHSRVFSAHQGIVTSVQFVDATTLATCGVDGVVQIWDLSRDAPITFDLGDIGMNSMALSPSGRLLLSVGTSEFQIIDTQSTNLVFRRTIPGANYYGAEWSISGDKAAVGSLNTTSVAIFDPAGRSICEIPHVGLINAFAFSPCGSRLAIIGEESLQIANSEDGQALYRRSLHSFGNAIKFSHDGSRIAYGGQNGGICLFDVVKLQPLYEIPCASDVHCLAFSPNDSTLVSGHGDSTIRIWEVGTGRIRGELAGHERKIVQLAFAPDAHTLLSLSDDDTARIWSLDHHRGLGTFHRRAVLSGAKGAKYCMSLSADGRTLATGYEVAEKGPSDLVLWRIESCARD
jgi:serine/threonine protein kinase/WD40 repeat protein